MDFGIIPPWLCTAYGLARLCFAYSLYSNKLYRKEKGQSRIDNPESMTITSGTRSGIKTNKTKKYTKEK